MNHPNQPPSGSGQPDQPRLPEIWRSSGDLFADEPVGDAGQHFLESTLGSQARRQAPSAPSPNARPNFDFGPGTGQHNPAYTPGVWQPEANAAEQEPPTRPQQIVYEEGAGMDDGVVAGGVVRGAGDPAIDYGYRQQQYERFDISEPPTADPHAKQGPQFVSHDEDLGITTTPTTIGGTQAGGPVRQSERQEHDFDQIDQFRRPQKTEGYNPFEGISGSNQPKASGQEGVPRSVTERQPKTGPSWRPASGKRSWQRGVDYQD